MTETMPYSQLEKGTLLIAAPELQSGIYFRSVLVVCEHGPTGSFGLVINKALDLELPDEILNLSNLANPGVGIRAGGPVQTNQMMLLHTSNTLPEQTLEVCEGVFLGGDLEFLQEILVDEHGPQVHLCFGYSGWAAGQLEREYLDGQWFLFPGQKKYIFDTPHDKLWQTLLREMGGKYATLSMIPEDLTLN